MSSPAPARPSGTLLATMSSQTWPRGMSSMRYVSMMPGQIALTRTWEWPSSEAMAQVRAWMLALDDEYAAALAAMIFPAIDEMLTMLPPSPCSTMARPNARLM